MKLTTKCQVTIPKEAREALGVGPLSEVEFIIDGNTVRIERADQDRKARAKKVVSALKLARKKKGNTDLATDEILALMRGAD